MTQERQPIDVSREIADILTEWRPEAGSHEDVATAIMHTLERYTINVAPTEESELRTIFQVLQSMIEERRMSF